jgi:hypothetical protein
MHLIQLLLPALDNDGRAIGGRTFEIVRHELTERFGGVTAYMRSPATGQWKDEDGQIDRDQMIMVEVVVEAVDRAWWADYRRVLEQRFAQEVIHVRALGIETL